MTQATMRSAGMAAIVAASLAWSGDAAAQDTTGAAMADSLARRLERAEARLDVLERQIAAQSSSAVHTRTRVRFELSGRLLVNAFTDTRRVNNVDNPQFVLSPANQANASRGFGMSPRQSMLRGAAIVPDVAGGTLIGDIDVDFYGGQQPSGGGRTFPLVRMRTMRLALRLARWELMAGQDVPLIAPLNPLGMASLGTPGFATAGNLWLWLPQLRATAEGGSRVRIGVQAAVVAPTSGDPSSAFDTDFDAAERSGRPFLQGRVRARLDDDGFAGEVGCGGHMGWLSVDPAVNEDGRSLVQSRAVACDARLPLRHWVEIRGEAYAGQALRGLGGGGIGQGIGPAANAVRDRGGWIQAVVKPTFRVSAGAGCGISDPEDADIAAGGRLRNSACAGFVQVRPSGPLFVALEGRRITTTYAAGRVANDHLNLAIGFEY